VTDQQAITILGIVTEKLDQIQSELAAVKVFNARFTDTTHFSIAEAARYLGVGKTTVRRRFAAHIEQIPHSSNHGIPIDIVRAAWVPVATARAARRKQGRKSA
jgi:hypothetical protein